MASLQLGSENRPVQRDELGGDAGDRFSNSEDDPKSLKSPQENAQQAQEKKNTITESVSSSDCAVLEQESGYFIPNVQKPIRNPRSRQLKTPEKDAQPYPGGTPKPDPGVSIPEIITKLMPQARKTFHGKQATTMEVSFTDSEPVLDKSSKMCSQPGDLSRKPRTGEELDSDEILTSSTSSTEDDDDDRKTKNKKGLQHVRKRKSERRGQHFTELCSFLVKSQKFQNAEAESAQQIDDNAVIIEQISGTEMSSQPPVGDGEETRIIFSIRDNNVSTESILCPVDAEALLPRNYEDEMKFKSLVNVVEIAHGEKHHRRAMSAKNRKHGFAGNIRKDLVNAENMLLCSTSNDASQVLVSDTFGDQPGENLDPTSINCKVNSVRKDKANKSETNKTRSKSISSYKTRSEIADTLDAVLGRNAILEKENYRLRKSHACRDVKALLEKLDQVSKNINTLQADNEPSQVRDLRRLRRTGITVVSNNINTNNNNNNTQHPPSSSSTSSANPIEKVSETKLLQAERQKILTNTLTTVNDIVDNVTVLVENLKSSPGLWLELSEARAERDSARNALMASEEKNRVLEQRVEKMKAAIVCFACDDQSSNLGTVRVTHHQSPTLGTQPSLQPATTTWNQNRSPSGVNPNDHGFSNPSSICYNKAGAGGDGIRSQKPKKSELVDEDEIASTLKRIRAQHIESQLSLMDKIQRLERDLIASSTHHQKPQHNTDFLVYFASNQVDEENSAGKAAELVNERESDNAEMVEPCPQTNTDLAAESDEKIPSPDQPKSTTEGPSQKRLMDDDDGPSCRKKSPNPSVSESGNKPKTSLEIELENLIKKLTSALDEVQVFCSDQVKDDGAKSVASAAVYLKSCLGSILKDCSGCASQDAKKFGEAAGITVDENEHEPKKDTCPHRLLSDVETSASDVEAVCVGATPEQLVALLVDERDRNKQLIQIRDFLASENHRVQQELETMKITQAALMEAQEQPSFKKAPIKKMSSSVSETPKNSLCPDLDGIEAPNDLLRQAENEITQLRNNQEILEAKLEKVSLRLQRHHTPKESSVHREAKVEDHSDSFHESDFCHCDEVPPSPTKTAAEAAMELMLERCRCPPESAAELDKSPVTMFVTSPSAEPSPPPPAPTGKEAHALTKTTTTTITKEKLEKTSVEHHATPASEPKKTASQNIDSCRSDAAKRLLAKADELDGGHIPKDQYTFKDLQQIPSHGQELEQKYAKLFKNRSKSADKPPMPRHSKNDLRSAELQIILQQMKTQCEEFKRVRDTLGFRDDQTPNVGDKSAESLHGIKSKKDKSPEVKDSCHGKPKPDLVSMIDSLVLNIETSIAVAEKLALDRREMVRALQEQWDWNTKLKSENSELRDLVRGFRDHVLASRETIMHGTQDLFRALSRMHKKVVSLVKYKEMCNSLADRLRAYMHADERSAKEIRSLLLEKKILSDQLKSAKSKPVIISRNVSINFPGAKNGTVPESSTQDREHQDQIAREGTGEDVKRVLHDDCGNSGDEEDLEGEPIGTQGKLEDNFCSPGNDLKEEWLEDNSVTPDLKLEEDRFKNTCKHRRLDDEPLPAESYPEPPEQFSTLSPKKSQDLTITLSSTKSFDPTDYNDSGNMQTGTPGESPSEFDKDESQSEKRCRHTREALQTLLNVIVSSNSDNEEIEAKKSNDGILKLALHRLAKRNLSLEMQLKHLVAEQRCQCPAELGELVIENGPSPYTPDPANFSPQKSGVWSPSFTIAKITPRANYSSSTASDSDLRALQTRCEKFGKENAKMRMELQKLKITLENERIEKALQPIHVRQASKKKKQQQQQKLIDDGDDGKRPSPVRLFKATRKFGTKIGHASGHHKHSSKNKNPAQNPGSQVINEGEIAPTSKLHPCVCLHDSNSTNSHTTPPT